MFLIFISHFHVFIYHYTTYFFPYQSLTQLLITSQIRSRIEYLMQIDNTVAYFASNSILKNLVSERSFSYLGHPV